MAFLQETAQWETGIYQIETTDFVVGGATGVTNTPIKQLANRTSSLRKNITDLTEALAVYKIATTTDLAGIHTNLNVLNALTTKHTGNISTLDAQVLSINNYMSQAVTPHIGSKQNPHQTSAEQVGALPLSEVGTTVTANMVVRRDREGKVVGDITGDALTVGGKAISLTSTPDTVAVRDPSGILVSDTFKSIRDKDNTMAADAYLYDAGDGLLRKKSLESARAELFTGVALGNRVAALSGVAYHGTVLPLPEGYTREQCFWVVGIGQFSNFGGQGRDGIDTVYCYVDNNLIINCYTTNGPTYYGYANYMVIGIK